jgi:diguanylate cyclase (GGDEF)-like protein/PAS domain S-box-containing protein
VRRADGVLVARSGPHAEDWAQGSHAHNNSEQARMVVTLNAAHGPWGRTEFAWRPVLPQTAAGWLADRMLWLAIGVPLVASLLAYAYLRRTLQHLNPLAAVPERLRDAFDGLTEGVALLDRQGRVVLANRALRRMAAVDEHAVHGRPFEEAASIALPGHEGVAPWADVLQGGAAQRGVRVLIGRSGDGRAQTPGTMNCSPIADAGGRVRGCLATIDDLSETEKRNEELRVALDELQRSRGQIQAQNDALIELAMRDPLTGLLNRRAFFEGGAAVLERATAEGRRVAVLMLDVDHFKRFNDQYGHATGDAVLQRVAACLKRTLREQDLVARYGGEEFCALMQDLGEAETLALAERVRVEIQRHAGDALNEGRSLLVTASVGWCWRTGEAPLADMLRSADTALYEAKRGGRNAVRPTLPSATATSAAAPATAVAETA